jgi:hypothetical protein
MYPPISMPFGLLPALFGHPAEIELVSYQRHARAYHLVRLGGTRFLENDPVPASMSSGVVPLRFSTRSAPERPVRHCRWVYPVTGSVPWVGGEVSRRPCLSRRTPHGAGVRSEGPDRGRLRATIGFGRTRRCPGVAVSWSTLCTWPVSDRWRDGWPSPSRWRGLAPARDGIRGWGRPLDR